jgi:hypothetical protein
MVVVVKCALSWLEARHQVRSPHDGKPERLRLIIRVREREREREREEEKEEPLHSQGKDISGFKCEQSVMTGILLTPPPFPRSISRPAKNPSERNVVSLHVQALKNSLQPSFDAMDCEWYCLIDRAGVDGPWLPRSDWSVGVRSWLPSACGLDVVGLCLHHQPSHIGELTRQHLLYTTN